jgi:hypothetical protein
VSCTARSRSRTSFPIRSRSSALRPDSSQDSSVWCFTVSIHSSVIPTISGANPPH